MVTLLKIFWDLAHPLSVFLLCLPLGLLLTTSRREGFRRWGRGILVASAIALFFTGALPLGGMMLAELERRFEPLDPPGEAELGGVIVLGGGVDAEMSHRRGLLELNAAGDRILAMLELLERYPSLPVVYSGGSGEWRRVLGGDADALKFSAYIGPRIAQGVILETDSRNTRENAVNTAALISSLGGGKPWILVTSAWHMPRAVGAYRALEVKVIPAPVDYRGGRPLRDGLLRWVRNFSELSLASKEWAGLFVYRTLGWSDSFFPAPEE